uniref:Uncharacterized protein n=1 Tax=Arundo donax TaxID=35708 RepID=A0A0A9B6S4_ARUDO
MQPIESVYQELILLLSTKRIQPT